jgi:hypothetical protein
MLVRGLNREDDVVLVPVEEAWALRPSLAHLGTTRAEAEAKAAAAAAAAESAAAAAQQQLQQQEEDEKTQELQPLTVSGRLLPGCQDGWLGLLTIRHTR